MHFATSNPANLFAQSNLSCSIMLKLDRSIDIMRHLVAVSEGLLGYEAL